MPKLDKKEENLIYLGIINFPLLPICYLIPTHHQTTAGYIYIYIYIYILFFFSGSSPMLKPHNVNMIRQFFFGLKKIVVYEYFIIKVKMLYKKKFSSSGFIFKRIIISLKTHFPFLCLLSKILTSSLIISTIGVRHWTLANELYKIDRQNLR